MKLFLQIFFLLLTWFTNLVNATPVFTKLALPSCNISISKSENVKEEGIVKIGVQNFARSGIGENIYTSKSASREKCVFEYVGREKQERVLKGAGNVSALLSDVERTNKECSPQEIAQGDNLLKTVINSTDAEHIADVINSVCLASIRKLSYQQIEKLIDNISLLSSIKEKYEVAVMRLMNAMKSSDYELFYTYLENNTNKKLIHFVSEMDDKSIYPWDGDNYTNFIGALCKMYGVNPRKFDEAGDYSHLSKIIDLGEIKFKASELTNFSLGLGSIYKPGTKRFNCDYNENRDGKIKIYEEEQTSTTTTYPNGSSIPAYSSTWSKIADYATIPPLTPILLTKSTEELPLVNTALEGSQYGGNIYVVPAIFLKYRKDKISNDAIEKGAILTLDVVTLVASGGTALAAQVTKVRRLWAMIEMAGAMGNIGVNTGLITNGKLKTAVDVYNAAMLIVGVKHLAIGGYKVTKNIVNFAKELPAQTKSLLQSNSSIRSLISAKYADWKAAINSIDNLSSAEKQLILEGKASQIANTTALSDAEKLALEEQHKAWKGMGVVEEVASGSWLEIKNNIVNRIAGKQGWTLKYSDADIQNVFMHGKSINLPEQEIEDIILNGCRPDKTFSATDLISQTNFWNVVKQRGYPNLFQSLQEYEQFSNVVKQLAQDWNLPTNNIFVQGSSLRMSNIADIGDLDIAIRVDAATFDNLVERFTNNARDAMVKSKIGRNGKIGGVDMFKAPNESGSFTGSFYPKFEFSFGQSFQTKLRVPSIQISIVKESGNIDISPFLKLK